MWGSNPKRRRDDSMHRIEKKIPLANSGSVLDVVIDTRRKITCNMSIEIAIDENRGRARDDLGSSTGLNHVLPAEGKYDFEFLSESSTLE